MNLAEELSSKIEEAELMREHRLVDEAIQLLSEIIYTALSINETSIIARAVAHRILCFEHLYKNTGAEEFLQKMLDDILFGIERLSVSPAEKAVFHLRYGVYYMLQGKNTEAESESQIAYDTAPEEDKAEYLGHLAALKALNGKVQEAIGNLLSALQLVQSRGPARAFHKMIIISGLYARLAKVAPRGRRYYLTITSLIRGYRLAWVLKREHGMPQMLNSYHQAILPRWIARKLQD